MADQCPDCLKFSDCTCFGSYSHSKYMRQRLKSMKIADPKKLVKDYLEKRDKIKTVQFVPTQTATNKAIAELLPPAA